MTPAYSVEIIYNELRDLWITQLKVGGEIRDVRAAVSLKTAAADAAEFTARIAQIEALSTK